MKTPIFIKACRGKAVPHTPVWIMRQAGRYQPSYRALRRRHSFMDMCKKPELSTKVTLRRTDQLFEGHALSRVGGGFSG